MQVDDGIISKLHAFYHIYPSMQSKLHDLQKKVEHLENARAIKCEEEKYEKVIIKQFIGKIKRIEQFLIEHGLIKLLGKKVENKDETSL
jgi:hypothetical protein